MNLNPKLIRVLIMGLCGIVYGVAVVFFDVKMSFDTVVAMVAGLGLGSQALPQVGAGTVHVDDMPGK